MLAVVVGGSAAPRRGGRSARSDKRRLGSGMPEQIQTLVKDFWSAQEPILTSMEPAPDPIKAEPGSGDPHYLLGLYGEFTVA